MSKEIEIGGCIEVPDEITVDEVCDTFIAFVESKGWFFGGGFHEVSDENADSQKSYFLAKRKRVKTLEERINKLENKE